MTSQVTFQRTFQTFPINNEKNSLLRDNYHLIVVAAISQLINSFMKKKSFISTVEVFRLRRAAKQSKLSFGYNKAMSRCETIS